jgi:hypothetical protein
VCKYILFSYDFVKSINRDVTTDLLDGEPLNAYISFDIGLQIITTSSGEAKGFKVGELRGGYGRGLGARGLCP